MNPNKSIFRPWDHHHHHSNQNDERIQKSSNESSSIQSNNYLNEKIHSLPKQHIGKEEKRMKHRQQQNSQTTKFPSTTTQPSSSSSSSLTINDQYYRSMTQEFFNNFLNHQQSAQQFQYGPSFGCSEYLFEQYFHHYYHHHHPQQQNSMINSGQIDSSRNFQNFFENYFNPVNFPMIQNYDFLPKTATSSASTMFPANNFDLDLIKNSMNKLNCHQQQQQPETTITSTTTSTATSTTANNVMKKQRPKRFQCPHCQVSFSNNGQLKGHIRIHTGK